MTLIGAILKKAQSKESVIKKFSSPPPELDESVLRKKKKKHYDKFGHVHAIVDSVPPRWDASRMFHALLERRQRTNDIFLDNVRMLCAITRAYMSGGKVGSRWVKRPPPSGQFYDRRRIAYEAIKQQNKYIYQRIINTAPRVVPTACLERDWKRNKKEIVEVSRKKFVLFPVKSSEIVEDSTFIAPAGVKRPRVYITLQVREAAVLGVLEVELFTDVCPDACRLFVDLLDGDGLGHSYLGTRFFRKVPHLYWSGGDVIYNNGFGCYAQRGRMRPIIAESYHFSHSMPGLLSMCTTSDEELCGIFNITYKALPQFDLKNVVFGRVIRPCKTYDIIREMGSPVSTHPIVEIIATRRRVAHHWVSGTPNTELRPPIPKHVPLK